MGMPCAHVRGAACLCAHLFFGRMVKTKHQVPAMRWITSIAAGICSLAMGLTALAQPAATKPSSALLHDLKKLNVLGSVLYIAAHPDDENTRLLAYLANGKQYRTAYLSLTRGDGGQNLIGDEQGIELGLIRTHELMAARRIDGAQQFFTRAYDFGFSKSPEETFSKWNHDSVLADVVWVVRTFQPDVIIARFPEDSRAGHGHHSASGILAREAFDAAADSTRFPEQFKYGVRPWQAKRMLWNTFNFGGRNTVDSTQYWEDAGGYNPLTGLSYGELAGESRSQHKSQGFGVPRSRGSQREFFTTIKGSRPQKDLLEGVDISWGRVAYAGTSSGALCQQQISRMVDSLVQQFTPLEPYKTVPGLVQLHKTIFACVPNGVWRTAKLAEVEELILQCAGLYAEATVQRQFLAEGDSFKVAVNLVNRSPLQVRAGQMFFAGGQISNIADQLGENQSFTHTANLRAPDRFMLSQPYWLAGGLKNEWFQVADQRLIGQPVNTPLSVRIELTISNNYTLFMQRPLLYKYTDPVKGEIYQPVFITPRQLLYSHNDIVIFNKDRKDSAKVKVNLSAWEERGAEPATVSLFEKNIVASQVMPAYTSTTDGSATAELTFPNFLAGTGRQKAELGMSVTTGGTVYANAQRTIQYDHIPTLRHYYQDKITVLNIDLKLQGKRVGYIEGAGDKVQSALEAMGYEVVVLKENDITPANLQRLDAIVTGVRAYNVHEFLTRKYDVLMEFVQNGGNLIVQYNTSNNIGPIKSRMSPYELGISRTRVTDEASPVRFLLPQHPVLNVPNKITQADFEGWIQERSIYHAGSFGAPFVAPLGLRDFNEGEESGSLVIAPYGKGNFAYTGLVFFRQLPAAVPGAFRLMANLIGLPKN